MPFDSPAADAARPGVRGYARPKRASAPRPVSRNTSLTLPQATDLINALAYAESGLPPDTAWAHVTAVLSQSADYIPGDARAYVALQAHILRRIGDFLRRHGLPVMFLAVREDGARYHRPHTHILLPIPPPLRGELEAVIRDAGRLRDLPNNRAVVITPGKDRSTGEPDTRGMHTPAMRRGVLLDFLKTMSPRARLNGVPVMQALGIRHRAPCTIHGKRTFTSQNLQRKARAAAGWRDLTTLADLRNALVGVIKTTRAERDRQKQRRHRARKAGPTVLPQPSSMPLSPPVPNPFDGTDLAADFLD